MHIPLPKHPPDVAITKARRSIGPLCLIADVIIISFLYFGYVWIILKAWLSPFTPFGIGVCALFHLFIVLFSASFIKATLTDPGSIPPNWGFYMGDKVKRRRYCKICEIWKPDRAHHCSACGRCILNMDHHCPWINNCVGFYNRKFFIQLLLYTISCLILILLQVFYYLFVCSMRNLSIEELDGLEVLEYIYACGMAFLSLILIFTLIPFTKFHLILLLRNSTTIENLNAASRESRTFDIGIQRNIAQVFGPNAFCWLAPCHTPMSRPAGDGVRWNMHYIAAADDEARE